MLDNGTKYEGEFYNDHYLKGIKVENGLFNGKGLIRKGNGDIWEGEFVNSYFKEGKV